MRKCRAAWFGVAVAAALLFGCAAACEGTDADDDGLEECDVEGGIYFGAQASLHPLSLSLVLSFFLF